MVEVHWSDTRCGRPRYDETISRGPVSRQLVSWYFGGNAPPPDHSGKQQDGLSVLRPVTRPRAHGDTIKETGAI